MEYLTKQTFCMDKFYSIEKIVGFQGCQDKTSITVDRAAEIVKQK